MMSFLYGFKYRNRFIDIINTLETNDNKILELCFGDIYIAEYCKKNSKEWFGIDLNERFVRYAGRRYNCICADLNTLDSFPASDVCIMSGSLYHFSDKLNVILGKMLSSSKKVVISEPVINLSSSKSIIGKLARISSNAGSGPEIFRYNEESFIKAINDIKIQLNFSYSVISKNRDILIVIEK
jgi:hypothetical protein